MGMRLHANMQLSKNVEKNCAGNRCKIRRILLLCSSMRGGKRDADVEAVDRRWNG